MIYFCCVNQRGIIICKYTKHFSITLTLLKKIIIAVNEIKGTSKNPNFCVTLPRQNARYSIES